jgi:hypothetical protein
VIDGCHVRCNIFLAATNIGSFDWTHTACKESKNKQLLGLFDTVPTSLFVKGINPSAMDHQIKKRRNPDLPCCCSDSALHTGGEVTWELVEPSDDL